MNGGDILRRDTVALDEKENALVIIDQTLLPGEVKMLSLRRQEDIREAIYMLRVRGAPAIGVAAAFSSAQLALAGIKSLVPFDQMAHVMLSVGHALPATLRETAKGGIAQAPAALSACAKCGVCG